MGAIEPAAYDALDNLAGVLDVKRLGQRGETMNGSDLNAYRRRLDAFGWRTVVVSDGHSRPHHAVSLGQAGWSATQVIGNSCAGPMDFLAGGRGPGAPARGLRPVRNRA